MPDAPTPHRTRLAAAAGLLGASVVTAFALGAGPAPSILGLAGASSDDVADDVSGNCDEVEHATDPGCAGTPAKDDDAVDDDDETTSSTVDDSTPPDDVRSLDAAGAGTVIYAIESGSLRLVTATPTSGWAVEVEQGGGREIELDFRSGTQRVQVNVEIEDGEVRERVRLRDDATDTDVRTEDGVVQADNSGPGTVHDAGDDNSGPGSVDDSADDNSGPGSGSGSDDAVDDSSGHGGDDSSGSGSSGSGSSGSGRDHPEDD
ncbi:MAG: hypothetical protein ACJ739_00195 [Acidimicrobiales bacterium]